MAHVANLLLLRQLRVPAIASLLAHAKQIAKVFRVGNFRKLFFSARLLSPHSDLLHCRIRHVVQET
jgi:hypothetical protein